mgnify:CR=1 FL=1
MAERLHDRCDGKGVGDLVDGPEPGPDVTDVARGREVHDVVNELGCGLDARVCDKEAEKVDLILCKLEFLWIECAAISRGCCKELAGPKKALFNVLVPEDGVINERF